MAMKCQYCGGTIHPERLAALPHTVTCSADHSQRRQNLLRKVASKKAHRRKRAAARAAKNKPIEPGLGVSRADILVDTVLKA